MDRAAPPAIRLPPVARFLISLPSLALALAVAASAPAAALALPPPPQRVAAVWGRPGWSAVASRALTPPPGRWEMGWEGGGPLALPAVLRSPRGRA